MVPDAEGDGSTLVTARAGVPWASAFGASSFERHVALGCAVLDAPADSSLRRDVDTPAHLEAAAELGLGPRTARVAALRRGARACVHHDIRLIAVDMDGTLLDGEGHIPDELWPLLDELDERGILFAPSSGRQLATLRRSFDHARDDVVYIAENGAYVVRGDDEIGSDAIDPEFAASVIRRVRDARATTGSTWDSWCAASAPPTSSGRMPPSARSATSTTRSSRSSTTCSRSTTRC